MMHIPDNYDAFCLHDAQQQAELDKLPKCCECGEPIQTEFFYEIDGDLYCPECMDDHKKWIDYFIDEGD